MTTVQSFIDARAPHYSADPRLGALITQASEQTGQVFTNKDDSFRNKAIALLVLHWMTLVDRDSNNQGIGGTIKREREGYLEREYMIDFSVTKMDPDLSQTTWGVELMMLRKSCIFKPMNRFSIVVG